MLPDFVVIGGMKCGSTSLLRYLNYHPDIILPRNIKNLEFFDEKENWNKGLNWYESFFPKEKNKGQVFGEVSTEYTKHPDTNNVAKNLAKTIPNAKLIYVIRHPYKRLISHYIHQVGAGLEQRKINTILRNIDNMYVRYSLYGYQLEQYLDFFSPSKILVLTSEELRRDKDKALSRIFRFIGVDESFKVGNNVSLNTSAERKKWNSIGRLIRRSSRNYNAYCYYKNKYPRSMRIADLLLCSAVNVDSLSKESKEKISPLFIEDIKKIEDTFGLDLSGWSFDEV
ncbi:sulfotransferase family protein [Aestuariirhabdus litorea]|uniref:Sulfotransferase n=1 Tax=Aestuariirhabdus litorea TaxID=2528527 RepID=A0A3P3VJJ0_9GAMM|nr:sulfotransferase [Aestuariirhabdus litorea]RRJ82534.1 sulfotransferase [Aestuariirhabdus litorea]RWW92695.1 sulfotransferase [Endozoicomonadaceae bacterium GTF-13]